MLRTVRSLFALCVIDLLLDNFSFQDKNCACDKIYSKERKIVFRNHFLEKAELKRAN